MKKVLKCLTLSVGVLWVPTAQACPSGLIGYKSAEHMEARITNKPSDTSLAFKGEVVSSSALWIPFRSGRVTLYDMKTKFRVLETIKGTPKRYQTIYHSKSDTCYGVTFSKGGTFFVMPRQYKRKWVVNNRAVGEYRD